MTRLKNSGELSHNPDAAKHTKQSSSAGSFILSKGGIIGAVFLCFAPACIFSIALWFMDGINQPFLSANGLYFWEFSLLVVTLMLVHMAMLLLFRELIMQITDSIYKYSIISGFATAPAVSLLNIDLFETSHYGFWEGTGMILLLCTVTAWGVTVLPYLPLALWYDFQNSRNSEEPDFVKPENHEDNSRPVYMEHEFRFEYTYDTKYRLRNIPLIEVHHNELHAGYLDPRWYQIYGYGPGDLGECWWRIILKKSDDTWAEISSRISQAEGDDPGDFAPSMLESRVSGAVKRVLNLKSNGFSFYEAEGELPEIKEKISCYDKNITQIAPLYISLDELIAPVVKGVMNQRMALGIQLELVHVPDATHIIDVIDTFDYSHYYMAVRPDENHEEVVRKIEVKSMQRVHKVWKVDEEDFR
ncbi:MAG TPA: hypothetical protein VF181_10300 [Balneolaceae bacterium]